MSTRRCTGSVAYTSLIRSTKDVIKPRLALHFFYIYISGAIASADLRFAGKHYPSNDTFLPYICELLRTGNLPLISNINWAQHFLFMPQLRKITMATIIYCYIIDQFNH